MNVLHDPPYLKLPGNIFLACLKYEVRANEGLKNIPLRQIINPNISNSVTKAFKVQKRKDIDKLIIKRPYHIDSSALKPIENAIRVSTSYIKHLKVDLCLPESNVDRYITQAKCKQRSHEDLDSSFSGQAVDHILDGLASSRNIDNKLQKFELLTEPFEESYPNKFSKKIMRSFRNLTDVRINFSSWKSKGYDVFGLEKFNYDEHQKFIESLADQLDDLVSLHITTLEVIANIPFLELLLKRYYSKFRQIKDLKLFNLNKRGIHENFLRGIKRKGVSQLERLNLELNFTFSSLNSTKADLLQDMLTWRPSILDFSLILRSDIIVSHKLLPKIYNLFSKGLLNVRRLELQFLNSDEFTDEGLEPLFEKMASELKQLRSLKLKFQGCRNIKNATLIALSRSIQTYRPYLTKLDLEFDFPDYGLAELAETLESGLEHLEELSISYIGGKYCNDDGLQTFSEVLALSLPKLESLSLSLSNSFIMDESIEALSTALLIKLNTLKRLRLVFDKSQGITDEGLKVLSNVFKANRDSKTLKSLHLCFGDNTRITNNAIEALSDALSEGYYGLRELDFDFHDCRNLKNKSLLVLGDALTRGFFNIHTLKICFAGCRITNEGVLAMNRALGLASSKISVLKIEFNYVNCVEEKTWEALWDSILVRLRNLTHLTCVFGRYSVLNEIVSDFREDILKTFSGLEEVQIRR